MGVNPGDIHCIGHSLGAHIVGHVGRNIKEFGMQGKIARVTGEKVFCKIVMFETIDK